MSDLSKILKKEFPELADKDLTFIDSMGLKVRNLGFIKEPDYIDKDFVINAIIGIGTIGYNEVHGKYAKFTGDQHNAEWTFQRCLLEKEPTDVLIEIYNDLAEAKRNW